MAVKGAMSALRNACRQMTRRSGIAFQHRGADVVAVHDLGHADPDHAGEIADLVEGQHQNGQDQYFRGIEKTGFGIRHADAGNQPSQSEKMTIRKMPLANGVYRWRRLKNAVGDRTPD